MKLNWLARYLLIQLFSTVCNTRLWLSSGILLTTYNAGQLALKKRKRFYDSQILANLDETCQKTADLFCTRSAPLRSSDCSGWLDMEHTIFNSLRCQTLVEFWNSMKGAHTIHRIPELNQSLEFYEKSVHISVYSRSVGIKI